VTVTVAAPAKINLWLRVGPARQDGFHEIDTLFCALELSDSVRLDVTRPGDPVRLRLEADAPLTAVPDLGPDQANLAVRAAVAGLADRGLELGLDLAVVKRIPAGAGLGGGSSDGAAVLRGLASLFPDAATDHAHDLAARLGSDVPFFVSGHALARGRGRGQRLQPLEPLPSRPVVLVLPPLHVPTAAAYRWLDDDRRAGPLPPPPHAGLRLTPALDWSRVTELARNDFEPVLFRRHPELSRIHGLLMELGAGITLLAGSGSTVFGVFQDEGAATAAVTQLQRRVPDSTVVLTRTRSR
jgi:4-diphosphocytidyl-2-C-methyl-D-erythritol kinase